MKKTKLVSMLLAAALTLTSVPMLALPAAASTKASTNANLLDGATTSVTVQKINASNSTGDKFMTACILGKNGASVAWNGFDFAYTLDAGEAAKELHFEFDYRFSNFADNAALASNHALYIGSETSWHHRLCFNTLNRANAVGLAEVIPVDGQTWHTYDIVIATKQEGGNYIHFVKGQNGAMLPVDLDNVGVYYMDGDDKVYVVETITDSFLDTNSDAYFVSRGGDPAYQLSENGYTSYDHVPSAGAGNTTSITYTAKNDITPGYYTLSGKYRLGSFFATGYSKENNLNTLNIKFAGLDKTVDLDYNWTAFNEIIKVESNTKTVTFTVGKTAASGAERSLDLADLELIYRGPLADLSVEGDLLADATVTGATKTEVLNQNADGSVSTYNNYARIYNLRWETTEDRLSIYVESPVAQTAYLEFDVRLAYPAAGGPTLRTCVASWGAQTVHHGLSTSWANAIRTVNLSAGGNNIIFGKGTGSSFEPFDLDNIAVYTVGANGVKNYLYGPVADNFDAHVGKTINRNWGPALLVASQTDNGEYLTSTDKTITFKLDEDLVPGYYTLNCDMRAGNYFIGGTTPANYDLISNNRTVTVTAGDATATSTVSSAWVDATCNLKITEATDTVTISAAEGPIDIQNVSLLLVQPLAITINEDDTLLKGSDRSASGVVSDETVVDSDNSASAKGGENYLTVYNRPWPHTAALIINTGVAVNPKYTYYVSMDIRSSLQGYNTNYGVPFGNTYRFWSMDGIKNVLNPKVSDTSSKDVNKSFYVTDYTGTYETGSGQWMFDVVPTTWNHVEAKLKPAAGHGSALAITVNRGMNSDYRTPLDIDNIKVWYENESGAKVTLYKNDFTDPNNLAKLSCDPGAKMTVVTDLPYKSVARTEGENSHVTYNFANGLASGKYLFTVETRAGEFYVQNGADNLYGAQIVYTFDNGATRSSTVQDISTAWHKMGFIVTVPEGRTLTSVALVYDAVLDFDFRNASLVDANIKHEGFPDVGIIMVLLRKMQGNVRIVKEKVNYVVNGDFEDATKFDFAKVTNSYAGLMADTWMNHSNYAGKMEIITLDTDGEKNNVMSVSGIQTNWNGIAYGLGVLQPGEYVFSGKLMLADNKAECSMRASVNTNASLDAYLAADNNKLFKVTGKEWTEFSYKFTVTEPVAASVRLRGGMGGAVDTQAFYLDDLAVTTTVEKTVYLGGTVEEVTEYFENGGFDDASAFDFAKVANTTVGLAKGAWMNNGNYATNMAIADLDGDNAMHVSGIQVNWSGCAVGIGELKAGVEYTVSCDVKLENKDDACNMRVYILPDSATKNDEAVAMLGGSYFAVDGTKWLHLESKVTLTEDIPNAVIKFLGGMGGEVDTKPYYIDNISVATVEIKPIEPTEAAPAN